MEKSNRNVIDKTGSGIPGSQGPYPTQTPAKPRLMAANPSTAVEASLVLLCVLFSWYTAHLFFSDPDLSKSKRTLRILVHKHKNLLEQLPVPLCFHCCKLFSEVYKRSTTRKKSKQWLSQTPAEMAWDPHPLSIPQTLCLTHQPLPCTNNPPHRRQGLLALDSQMLLPQSVPWKHCLKTSKFR